MRKYLFVLLIALILVTFASCATKAPAEEASVKEAPAEQAVVEPQAEEAGSIEVPSAYAHFETSDNGKYLVVIIQCYPDDGWLWNPLYESEDDAKKAVWVESEYAVGTYKFEDAETELQAQKHVFEAAAPTQNLVFGLSFKHNGGERKAEFLVQVTINDDLTFQILDYKMAII